MFSDKDIAHFSKLETPFYYYDLNLLEQTLNACNDAAKAYHFHVHYAMKANFNEMVLKKIKAIGFGADCVSGNEVKKAIEIGFVKNKVVFAGVGKSDKEITDAKLIAQVQLPDGSNKTLPVLYNTEEKQYTAKLPASATKGDYKVVLQVNVKGEQFNSRFSFKQ